VLFAGESVVLRHDRTAILLDASVRIIVDVLLTRATRGILDYGMRSQITRKIVMDGSGAIAPSYAFPVEEDIHILEIPGQVSLGQRLAGCAPSRASRRGLSTNKFSWAWVPSPPRM
jgi:hypothetical protein